MSAQDTPVPPGMGIQIRAVQILLGRKAAPDGTELVDVMLANDVAHAVLTLTADELAQMVANLSTVLEQMGGPSAPKLYAPNGHARKLVLP